jgi:hypothetical protein
MNTWEGATVVNAFKAAVGQLQQRIVSCIGSRQERRPVRSWFGVPAGFSQGTSMLAAGLCVLTVAGGCGALLFSTLAGRDLVLSSRETLAMIAAQAGKRDASASTPRAPAQVPAAIVAQLTEALDQNGFAHAAAEVPLPDADPMPEAPTTVAEAPEVEPEFPFTGVWATNEKACRPQLNRGGYLPTIINEQGAWAGETTCAFKSTRQEGTVLVVSALCSDPQKSWRSQVRLTVAEGRLIWKSQSGTRSYVRCEQDPKRTRIAEAREISH